MDTASKRGQIGTRIYRNPGIYQNYSVSGITRDGAGAILPFCRVELYLTAADVSIREVTSDVNGNYRFDNPGTGPFYLVAYKAGAPDIAGTTVNTLVSV